MRGHAALMPKETSKYLVGEKNGSSGTAVGVTRCIETVAKTPGKSGKNFGQKITGAFLLNSTEHRSPIKERNLGNELLERKKKKKDKYILNCLSS